MSLLLLLKSPKVTRGRETGPTIGPATSDLLISRPGPAETLSIQGIGVSASWVIRPPGTLSAEMVTADLVKTFGTVDLRGRWIRWDHPTAGAWAGVVTLCRPVMSGGNTEVAARDFSFLLSHKRTAKDYSITGAPAGALAARVVQDATRVQHLWISDIIAEETGAPIGLDSRGEDVLNVLNRLADESDQEWRVTTERVLEWRQRLGTDRSSTVVLMEGREIVDVDYPMDLEAVINDLLAIPANADYARTNALVVESVESIAAVGTRMQGTVVVEQAISEATIRPLAEATLSRLTKQGRAPTITTVDHDGIWAQFREGDTVSVLLPSLNLHQRMRVMSRALDLRSGTMTLAMDVVS